MRRPLYIVAAAILALIVGGWIWLTVPYLEATRVRIDDRAVEVIAVFSNETSDPLCTKLYALVEGQASNEPIFSRVATDVPDPNNDVELKDGDQIQLTGYRYEWRERNRITGHEVKRRDGRIDVVGWRKPSGVDYSTKLDPTAPPTFSNENYVSCR